jgi:hypothetical protein
MLSSLPSAAMAVENNSAPIRSLVDRPDDLVGYQLRLIYVVPADVKDRNLDTNGTISTWIDEVRRVSKVQTGLTPRFDSFQNKFDVGFLKSKYTIGQLIGTSGTNNADDLLRKELPAIEQDSLKGVGFIIDGKVANTSYCGYASRPGKYFTAWLGEQCESEPTSQQNSNLISYTAQIVLHEWLHNLGVKHTCVKNDLMWGDGCEAIERGDGSVIDGERVNYLRANKSGIDVSLLPVWEETFNSGRINLEFESTTKSSNPWRSSAGGAEIWGSFRLSKDWAVASSTSRTCEIRTSTGVILASLMTGTFCESKLPYNVKIGTRIYMKVTIEGLWHRSTGVLVFDVKGENGEERHCESSTCVFGETLQIDIDLCFAVEGFAKLQLKQNETWKNLKTHRLYKGYSGCSSAFPFFASTTLKELPVGTHTLKWIRSSDRGFIKSTTSYREFQIVIQPEVGK